jgi:carbonic anhydrase
MNKLVKIDSDNDIFPEYRGTPIAHLLEYHNLDKPFSQYDKAKILIGMCMDNRKHLHIPDNYAYIIRSGGANLRYSEFKVSYAIAVGQVRHIALIGHNNCGMSNLFLRKDAFIDGLVQNAGWERSSAEDHFHHFVTMFEIGSETDFILCEVKRLRMRYPKVTIAPMMYLLEDNKLYLINE